MPTTTGAGSSPSSLEKPPSTHFLAKMFRAFGYREFRLLWLGAFASTVGTWMQEVAQNWLVLTLTGSAFLLGLDAFLGDVPIILFSLVGGVIADRLDRRKLLLTSQYLQMSFALILAALIYTHKVTIWQILLLSFLTGSAQAFGGPAYQALVPTLVQKQDLSNAIALNSIQFNLARIIGPLAAGLAFTALGAAACFLLNGVSFLAVILSLSLLKTHFIPKASGQDLMTELRGGLFFVKDQPALRSLTVLAFCSTFFGIPLMTMLPLFAKDIYHLGPKGYSMLMAFFGSGAVLGALLVAALGSYQRKARATLLMQVMFGIMVIIFSFSRNLGISLAALLLAGIALISVFAMISSLVQLLAPEAMRGRIMSIYMIAFRGGMPLGSLVTGSLASLHTPSVVLACNGLFLSVVAGGFLFFNKSVKEL